MWCVTQTTAPLEALDGAGYRITGPRQTVSELVARRAGPFSAADLEADARQRRLRIGRATIFRALDLFVELGVVERLDLPSGEHAYIRCEPAHHHHLVCSRCGRAEEVDDAGLQEVTGAIGQRTGYRIDSHRLELFGLCPACARQGGPESRDG
jgi:Fur family transcriptional regulator, ferric uptake regulator